MDESGFAIGDIEASQRIINATIRQAFQAKPGRQEWITSIECICADEIALPSLIIFKGENLSRQWIPATIHNNWRFGCNTKGWTSNVHGLQWLRSVFEAETREKANGKPRLLICDGHDSHITASWIAHCMRNNIILMVLPPHSSHLTQPLDVGVFKPLKTLMATEIEPVMRSGVARIQKLEWLTAFVAAHDKALCSKNILGGFRGTGIHPFLPTKVLRRVTSTPSPEPPSRPSTPQDTLTAFNEAVFTDSPADFNAVQRANVALNSLLDSNEPLPSPAKNLSGTLQGQSYAFMQGIPS